MLNRKQSPIEDVEIEDYMTTQPPTSTNTVWQHATATRSRSDAQSVLNKSSLTPFTRIYSLPFTRYPKNTVDSILVRGSTHKIIRGS